MINVWRKQGLRLWFCLAFTVSIFGVLQGQAVWHVTTIDDNDDGSCNAGHCSLREAINASNLNMGPDSIVFDIPGAGPYTITPLSPLPAITDSFLVIDGTHQPGNFPMAGLIRIDGSNLAGPDVHGLVVYVRRVKLTGLQIQNFPGDGIRIEGGVLDDNFVSHITIGGYGEIGNVIINCDGDGIKADIDSNFTMQANYLGTNLQFDPGLGNGENGAYLKMLSGLNTVIGNPDLPFVSEVNFFCSNTYNGMRITFQDAESLDPNFTIFSNTFGSDQMQVKDLGNQGMSPGGNQNGGGLYLDGAHGSVTVGGDSWSSCSGFFFNPAGIVVDGSNNKTLTYNYFHCNDDGIILLNGGNDNLPPPYALCMSGSTLNGYAEPNCTIHVYWANNICPGSCQSSAADLGITTSAADGSWSISGVTGNPLLIVATATNANGSTSPFSLCLGEDTVSVSAVNNGPICEGDFAALSATPSMNLQGISYAWTGPDGFTASTQNPANANTSGEYTVYLYVGDCVRDSASTTLEILALGRDTITDFCLGDSWTINGNTYDFMNTDGVEVIPGGAANGCDSIVVFDMNLNPSILGRVFVPQFACAGDMITLQFEMIPLSGPYEVVYMSDNGTMDTLRDIFDGHQIQVPIQSTTIFEVVDIYTDLTICAPIIGGPDTVFVSDIEIDPLLSDYNGFNVSCPYLSDGTIDITYTGEIPPARIRWADDTTLTSAMRTGLAPGSYSVSVTDTSGCSMDVTIDLESPEPLQPDVERVSTSCYGAVDGMLVFHDVLHAQGVVTGNLDSLQFFQFNSYPYIFDLLEAGLHTVDLEDEAGCMYQYEFMVPTGPMAPIDIGPDRRIARGDSLQLDIEMGFPAATIQWQPAENLSCSNCPNPVAMPVETTQFSVTVTDSEGCISEDAMTIEVYIPQNVYIPNVFSPNNDGQNDIFYIFGNDSVEEGLRFYITDRRGNVVFDIGSFDLNNPNFGWDGTWNGAELNPDVFTYAIQIRFITDQERWYTGTVTLVR